ncbi:chloride channel protein [Paenibacillus sp. strain BS8-2]
MINMPSKQVIHTVIRWIALSLAAGLTGGSASAFFLTSLETAAHLQGRFHFLLWLLPVGGTLISLLYIKIGKESARGNNLLFEQVHDGTGQVPLRMAPLVWLGTIITHLFGGSAGREGTAVQLGGSLAGTIGKHLSLSSEQRRLLIICGISAGFGSVFGIPLAGAVFAIEVSAPARLRRMALFPSLLAGYSGHYVALAWGAHHVHYAIGSLPPITWLSIVCVLAAAIMFGGAAKIFVILLAWMKSVFARLIPYPAMRPFIGGLLIIAMVYGIGTRDYLGLGLPLMEHAFAESSDPWQFILKLMFTIVTLGAGFYGGEVTPLFVIGATLGSALSPLLSLPASFLAALGLSSVFGAASRAPIACFILSLELFGAGISGAFYFALACCVSFAVARGRGIYESHVRYYVPKR